MDKSKNFDLSEEQFSLLLAKLRLGDETLIEIIAKSHFQMCQNFLTRQFKIDPEMAYDVTADTLLKFRKNLLMDKIQYGNLAALFTIDAKNSCIRMLNKSNKNPVAPLESVEHLTDDVDLDYEADQSELMSSLTRALGKLGSDCYQIIQQFYYLDMSNKQICQARIDNQEIQHITEASVKTKIADRRKKLKNLMS